ncbi:MAG: peptidoglycan bridge formation glycyltransferase FemA/FemB family protein, partial [Anaerolineales bacterium]|nr:peptidoglycan bridge formation glycyltransferase FemA/FemB family protein [Anaerolineales bacterium]
MPEAHLLQSAQWAELKGHYGWQPFFLVWQGLGGDLELTVRTDGDHKIKNPVAAALVLERKAFRGVSIIYVPKGPVLRDWSDKDLHQRVISDLQEFAKKAGAIQIKIDPDLVVGRGVPGEEEAETDP